jgi:DNA-binding transcriptional LysR family regulator
MYFSPAVSVRWALDIPKGKISQLKMKNIHSMLDLHAVSVFLQAARAGSFTQAGKQLCISPSAVSKAISRLENDLGQTLLIRTPRQVSLTPAGYRFFEEAEQLVVVSERARNSVSTSAKTTSKNLRVAFPIHFGRVEVSPQLAFYTQRYPHVKLEYFLVNNGQLDMKEYRIDVALLVADVVEVPADYVCKVIDSRNLVLCASPSYLARYGTPETTSDLDNHRTLGAIDERSGKVMPWMLNYIGRTIECRPDFNLLTNSIDAILEMALTDNGIALIPDYIAEKALKSGRLTSVLRDHHPVPQTIQITYRRKQASLAHVAAFIEFLTNVVRLQYSSASLHPKG